MLCKILMPPKGRIEGELEDKIQGLSLRTEDYIVKPFEMLELIVRIGVVLQRKETFVYALYNKQLTNIPMV